MTTNNATTKTEIIYNKNTDKYTYLVNGCNVFVENMYISKLRYPIANTKWFRICGIGGEVQDILLEEYNTDTLFFETLDDVKEVLDKVFSNFVTKPRMAQSL